MVEGGSKAFSDVGARYAIGDAARLLGVSRAMLRLWERERLIVPRRSAGGHRLYSDGDLDRLRRVARLRRVERLNSAAIRRELGEFNGPARDGGTSKGAMAEGVAIGARLRAMRGERGWSLAAVAARCGLSVSFLSAVERDQANPSVGTLFKLADAYGTTVPGLSSPISGGVTAPPDLLRPNERRRFVAGHGTVVIEDLIAVPGALEAQRIEVLAGGGSEGSYNHPGEEFVYVLTGSLTFWLDERHRYRLARGDSLAFRSTRQHRWRNDGAEPATLLWVNVPLVEASPEVRGGRETAASRGPRPVPEPASPDRAGGSGGCRSIRARDPTRESERCE